MDIDNINSIESSISTEKSNTHPFNPDFSCY